VVIATQFPNSISQFDDLGILLS